MTTVRITLTHEPYAPMKRKSRAAGANEFAAMISAMAVGSQPGTMQVTVGSTSETHDYGGSGDTATSSLSMDLRMSEQTLLNSLIGQTKSMAAVRVMSLLLATTGGINRGPSYAQLDGGFTGNWGDAPTAVAGGLPSFTYPDVVGTQGFTDTGTGAYLAASDPLVGQIQDAFTAFVFFRMDALPSADENLLSKGSGTANEWRIRYESAGSLLRCEVDGCSVAGTDYYVQAEDVGKTFIWGFTRTATDLETFMYRATDGVAARVGGSTGGSSGVVSGTEPLAIGALDGNGGGLEAESFTIIGGAICNATMTHDAISTYLQSCALAGKMLAFPSANEWRANAVDSWADEVGSADLTPTGDQSGDLTEVTFTPDFQGDWDRFFLVAGQSNALGQSTLASVPTSPTDYSAAYAPVPLYPDATGAGADWGDTVPLADNDWGPELSLARDLDAALAESFRILKVAISGTSLAVDWDPSGGTAWNNFLQDIDLAFNDPDESDINRKFLDAPLCMGVFWIQGEDDANDAGRAAAYQANLDAWITNFKLGKYAGANARFTVDPSFLFVDVLISDNNTVDAEKATVNAAKTAVAAARSDVVLLDPGALTFKVDNRHFDEDGLIGLGSALAARYIARADGTA